MMKEFSEVQDEVVYLNPPVLEAIDRLCDIGYCYSHVLGGVDDFRIELSGLNGSYIQICFKNNAFPNHLRVKFGVEPEKVIPLSGSKEEIDDDILTSMEPFLGKVVKRVSDNEAIRRIRERNKLLIQANNDLDEGDDKLGFLLGV